MAPTTNGNTARTMPPTSKPDMVLSFAVGCEEMILLHRCSGAGSYDGQLNLIGAYRDLQ